MTPPLPSVGALALTLGLAAWGGAAAWSLPLARWCAIALIAAILSGARAQFDRGQIDATTLPPAVSVVRGTVAEVPRAAGRATAFIVNVEEISSNGQWQDWPGHVEARTFGWAPAEGDRVQITGEPRALADAPGAPKATILRRQRVTQEIVVDRMQLISAYPQAVGWRGPERVRTWMEQRIDDYLGNPQGALIAGLLLGSRSDLSADIRTMFAQTGTSHIVAVSGFNVVIVSGFLTRAALPVLGARGSALAAMLAVLAYTLIVGAPASAVRAALMAGGALGARIMGRPTDSLGGLLLAGAGMTLADPLVVQDLGFQLSMLATAGLILLIPGEAWREGWRGITARLAMPPLAAEVATLPLVLHTFHSLSIIALVANVVVAILVPIAMAAGGLLVLLAGIEPLALPVAWVAWLAATAVLESVRFFASLPGAWLATGTFPAAAVIGCYASLLLWVLQRSPELRSAERLRSLIRVAAPLALGMTALGLLVGARPGGQLTGELLEFGNLMVATTPTGKIVVVGTDVSPTVLTSAIAERLPFWKRSVDVVALNNDTPAAWRGAQAIAERYSVEVLVAPSSALAPGDALGAARLLDPSNQAVIDLGDDVLVRLANPLASSQNRSPEVPLAIAYGATGIWFSAAGIEPPVSHEAEGWITVTRASRSGAAGASPFAARVAWDRSAARGNGTSGLDLNPRADGPVAFSSNGAQLTIRWSGCGSADSVCSAVLGASQAQ